MMEMPCVLAVIFAFSSRSGTTAHEMALRICVQAPDAFARSRADKPASKHASGRPQGAVRGPLARAIWARLVRTVGQPCARREHVRASRVRRAAHLWQRSVSTAWAQELRSDASIRLRAACRGESIGHIDSFTTTVLTVVT